MHLMTDGSGRPPAPAIMAIAVKIIAFRDKRPVAHATAKQSLQLS